MSLEKSTFPLSGRAIYTIYFTVQRLVCWQKNILADPPRFHWDTALFILLPPILCALAFCIIRWDLSVKIKYDSLSWLLRMLDIGHAMSASMLVNGRKHGNKKVKACHRLPVYLPDPPLQSTACLARIHAFLAGCVQWCISLRFPRKLFDSSYSRSSFCGRYLSPPTDTEDAASLSGCQAAFAAMIASNVVVAVAKWTMLVTQACCLLSLIE